MAHGPHVRVPTHRRVRYRTTSQGSLPVRAGSPLAGRVSHPLDDKRSFMKSSHTPILLDQPFLVAPSSRHRAPTVTGVICMHSNQLGIATRRWPTPAVDADSLVTTLKSNMAAAMSRLLKLPTDRYATARVVVVVRVGCEHTPHQVAWLARSRAARACLFAPSSCAGTPWPRP